MSPRQRLLRGTLIGTLAAIAAAGVFLAYVAWYTGTDRILPGVTVGSTPVGGLPAAQAIARVSAGVTEPPSVRAQAVGGAGERPLTGRSGVEMPQRYTEVRLLWQDRGWLLPLQEIGALPDAATAVGKAVSFGREGRVWQRARTFLTGLARGHYIPLERSVQKGALAQRLAEIAREIERPPVNATYDPATGAITPEVPGQRLDVEASLPAVERAVLAGRPEVELVVRTIPASLRREDLAVIRNHRVARFTTPILSADPGRVHNIRLAVSKINGVVLQPGDVFSFNNVVGPRDEEHGWAQAKELYQGEFVLGYGGGICQVSSTLYNSVLLAGLQIQERYHHDRPLAYVQPGRDATVAWKVLDFRFRNSAQVPVLIGARVLPGSPQEIEVTLHASRPVHLGEITLEEADVKWFPPPMEEVPDPTLPEGAREVEDEGHYGLEVKTYRVFRQGGAKRRELVSHDRYEPKPGKVRVGVVE